MARLWNSRAEILPLLPDQEIVLGLVRRGAPSAWKMTKADPLLSPFYFSVSTRIRSIPHS